MPKHHSMRKSAGDRKADEERYSVRPAGDDDGDRDGVTVHLDHHHLKKMGLDAGKMKHGDRVSFSGEGQVEHAEVQSGEGGERHSARVRLSHAGMDHEGAGEPERDKAELRGEIEAAHGKSESAKG